MKLDGDFKDLTKITASDEILCDKAFSTAKNPKQDECKNGLASMADIFFDKKPSGSGTKMRKVQKKALAEDIHKLINRNLIKENYIYLLSTIYGMLILLICN